MRSLEIVMIVRLSDGNGGEAGSRTEKGSRDGEMIDLALDLWRRGIPV